MGGSSRFILTTEGAFNRIRWAPGITMYGRDVRSTIGALDAISSAGKKPLLIHIGLMQRITAAARELLIEDTCSSRTAIVGSDLVGMVITAFAYTSATPTRYFTSEADALAWLLEDG